MCTNLGTPYVAMGTITIIISVLSVILQLIASATAFGYGGVEIMLVGVWCGVVSLIPGILSIVLGKRLQGHQGPNTTHHPLFGGVLGTSIISLIFSVTLFAFSVLAVVLNQCTYRHSINGNTICYSDVLGMSLGGVLAIVALAQFFTSMAMLIYSSRHLCCRQVPAGPPQVFYAVSTLAAGYPNYLNSPPGQYMHGVPTVASGYPQPENQLAEVGMPIDNTAVPNKREFYMQQSPPPYPVINDVPGIQSAVLTHPN